MPLLLGNLLFSKPMVRTTLISGLIDLCQLPYASMTHQLFCHSAGPASALLLILPWTLLLARVSIARVLDGHKLFYNTNPQPFLLFCYCSVSLTMAAWVLSLDLPPHNCVAFTLKAVIAYWVLWKQIKISIEIQHRVNL